MCGIVGIVNLDDKPICSEELKNFRDSIEHRGPDDMGIFVKNNIGFGHRRLSIIDLTKNGSQPMIYNDRFVITYNGECYNFEEIKEELKNKGFKFQSNTDTEVILAGYQCWGENIQNKLNGMWAFAIYDLKKNEVFLSRDRFGIKPIYYFKCKNRIAFASEMKAFMFLNDKSRPSFDDNILINLRIHESIEKTFLKNVFSLPPGCSIKIKDKKLSFKKWWNLKNNLIEIDKENIYEEFYEIFNDSLKKTLVSDVKVAFTLSGGLDSSSLALASNNIIKDDNQKISPDYKNFFSLKYKDHEKYDDKVITELKKNQNVNILEIDKNRIDLEKIIKNTYFFESIEESAIGPFELYKNIKSKGFKVSIDGHGPDEMLGGYDTHIIYSLLDSFFNSRRLKNINNLSSDISSNLKKMSRKDIIFFIVKKLIKVLIRFNEKHYIHETNRELFNLPTNFKFLRKKNEINFSSFLNNRLYNDFHFGSLPDILRKFDRISMSNSIESRVPYLDHRFVSYCFSLGSSFKIDENTKEILRKTLLNKINLPKIIFERKKKEGFVSPPDWYVKNMEIFIKETLANSDFSSIVSFCNTNNLKKFVENPTYTSLKRAFAFCQTYHLKKTFLNASSNDIR